VMGDEREIVAKTHKMSQNGQTDTPGVNCGGGWAAGWTGVILSWQLSRWEVIEDGGGSRCSAVNGWPDWWVAGWTAQ